MKERKRKITIITIIGIMLFSCVATLSYALWERLFTQSDENRITTLDCFNITYENESAATTLNGAVPIKEEEGLKLTPYKITIKNTCDTNAKYNVILNRKKGSTLDNKFVRTAVDKKTLLLSDATQIETRKINNFDNEASYIIGSGFVTGKQEKTIEIRSWMDWETQPSEGQNKTFTYKITVETGATNENPALSDEILANNDIKPDSNLDFTKGFPNSSTNEEDIKNKSGLYVTEDDDGNSYYFRGKVDNNYVKLGRGTTKSSPEVPKDLLWRIVRINGDGSIRLILDEPMGDSFLAENIYRSDYLAYTYNNESPCTKDDPCISELKNGSFENNKSVTDSKIKTYLEDWYKNNLIEVDDKIEYGRYCNDYTYPESKYGESTLLNPYLRIKAGLPSLKCPDSKPYGGNYILKIGLLNADEMTMAGLSWSENIPNANGNNYLYKTYFWWSMSPYDFINAKDYYDFKVISGGNGSINISSASDTHSVVPVINLSTDVTFTTAQPDNPGTADNPYIIE